MTTTVFMPNSSGTALRAVVDKLITQLLYTPRQAAPLLGVSEHQVRELCRRWHAGEPGGLRCSNPTPGGRGGRYVIPADALVGLMAEGTAA